jgi:toxin-antitoxin system PIN domain toxin
MIKPDVNILVCAYDDTSSFHKSASLWLEKVLSDEQVFLSWHTICGFLRIITNNRIYKNPVTIDQAIEIVDAWIELENTHIVAPEKRHWPIFAKMLTESQAAGNLVMDAHVAAMAASCGASVASTDRDFTRFPGIRFVNPIASKT